MLSRQTAPRYSNSDGSTSNSTRADEAPSAESGGSGKPAAEQKTPCAFYLRTGTCAYGDRCRFYHPDGTLPPPINSMGYPLREREEVCLFYIRRGWCAFGGTCKYHHPELSTGAPVVTNQQQPQQQPQQQQAQQQQPQQQQRQQRHSQQQQQIVRHAAQSAPLQRQAIPQGAASEQLQQQRLELVVPYGYPATAFVPGAPLLPVVPMQPWAVQPHGSAMSALSTQFAGLGVAGSYVTVQPWGAATSGVGPSGQASSSSRHGSGEERARPLPAAAAGTVSGNHPGSRARHQGDAAGAYWQQQGGPPAQDGWAPQWAGYAAAGHAAGLYQPQPATDVQQPQHQGMWRGSGGRGSLRPHMQQAAYQQPWQQPGQGGGPGYRPAPAAARAAPVVRDTRGHHPAAGGRDVTLGRFHEQSS